ncbi:hypothetical protein ACVWXN_003438 [Bradyrhizobium sp. i1.4.4]
MKLILESTAKVERVNGVPARVWQGKTETGIDVTCWISIVQVRKDADCEQFERELQKIGIDRQLVAMDMRMVID